MHIRVLLFSILFCLHLFSQETNYSVLSIPENLKENANTVIRQQQTWVKVKSISNVSIKTKKVTTVLNEKGINNIDAFEYYDKSTNVVAISAVVYDKFGKELKKLKRKDFSDNAIANSAAEISDARILSLQYTPIEYPFTIVYESEIATSNTAFLPKFYPLNDYYESVENTFFKIEYPSELGLKYKEVNFDNTSFTKKEQSNGMELEGKNILAVKKEFLSSFRFPYVFFGLNRFSLEGVEGNASNWNEFGVWMHENLLKNTRELSEETKSKIIALTQEAKDPIQKARIVYQYVQDKTRYISIQLGIGGWKPMSAKEVDRIGYGDCKALTNYTKALLDVVGVPSYYTIIYGSSERQDILEDFVAMQGNHVVLAIPNQQKFIFLECTSQTKAFGFEGNFTNDRNALLIKPDGAQIVRTNSYIDKTNQKKTIAKMVIDQNDNVQVNVSSVYGGILYDQIAGTENEGLEKNKEEIRERYSYLRGLQVKSISYKNNKEKLQLEEKMDLFLSNAIQKLGSDKIVTINILNPQRTLLERYRNRKNDFQIKTGYYEEDDVEIQVPSTSKLLTTDETIVEDSKYGKYFISLKRLDATTFNYKRTLFIPRGNYLATEYEEFRKFQEKIAKADNLKLIIQE